MNSAWDVMIYSNKLNTGIKPQGASSSPLTLYYFTGVHRVVNGRGGKTATSVATQLMC